MKIVMIFGLFLLSFCGCAPAKIEMMDMDYDSPTPKFDALYWNLQETIYSMVDYYTRPFSHSQEQKLIKAFGLIDMFKIRNMLLKGSFEYIRIDWDYYEATEQKNAALEELCASRIFYFPLIIDERHGIQEEMSYHGNYGDQIGNCKLQYRGILDGNYLPILPYASLEVRTMASFTEKTARDVRFRHVQRITHTNMLFNYKKIVDFLKMMRKSVRDLEIDLHLDPAPHEANFQALVDYLKSPQNEIQSLSIHNTAPHEYRQYYYEKLKEAFESENLRLKHLTMTNKKGHRTILLVRAIRHKLESLKIEVFPQDLSSHFYAEIVHPSSSIRSLSLFSTMVNFVPSVFATNGVELSKALRSETNKIDYLELGRMSGVPLHSLTEILTSENNKLKALIIDTYSSVKVSSVNEWNEFVAALHTPTCKLKYLKVTAFLPLGSDRGLLKSSARFFLEVDLKIHK